MVEYDCLVCGTHVRKERTPGNLRGSTPKYCSHACKGGSFRKTGPDKGKRSNTNYKCETCGQKVSTYRSSSSKAHYTPRFCSLGCLGRARTGDRNPAWSGGRVTLNTGYIAVLAPDHPYADVRGYVLEHRLVMETVLGRLLEAEETVHHINGVKGDNGPENLQLFASHTEHMRFHARQRARAKEMVL